MFLKENLNKILISSFLFLFGISLNAQVGCPNVISGYTLLGEYDDSQYFISNESTKWQAAESNANATDGYLASITSQAENDFIFNNINEIVFIGLNDAQNEGNFSWDSGEPFSFSKFADTNTASKDYGKMNFWNGNWGVDSENVSRRAILEVPCSGGGGNGISITNCPSSFTIVAPHGGSYEAFVDWDLPTATTDCASGGLTLTQITGGIPGFMSPITSGVDGIFVQYQFSDACGNTETCTFTFKVVPAAIEVTCPNDISIAASSPAGAIVNYPDPTILSYCNPGSLQVVNGFPSGSVFPIGTTTVELNYIFTGPFPYCGIPNLSVGCSFNVTVTSQGSGCPNDISGFTTIGEFGDSKYYLSNSVSQPAAAQAVAESNSGYLAVISSQAENDFIQQNINMMTYIGLNDVTSEGNLQWVNGEPLTFDNVDLCGFCEENSASKDYVIMAPWNGDWSFSSQWNSRPYVMEIPCSGGGNGINLTSCPSSIYEVAPHGGNYEVFIDWDLPTATTDCPNGGLTLTQITGGSPGFFSGPTPGVDGIFVQYEFTDACGNSETCTFTFRVVPAATELNCSNDITIQATSGSGAVVNYDIPSVISYCGNPPAVLTNGLPSGSVFPIGTSTVEYTLSIPGVFPCFLDLICSFDVTVTPDGGDECSFITTFSTAIAGTNISPNGLRENTSNSTYEVRTSDVDPSLDREVFVFSLDTEKGEFQDANSIFRQGTIDETEFSTYWDIENNILYGVRAISNDILLFIAKDAQSNIIVSTNIDISDIIFEGFFGIQKFDNEVIVTSESTTTGDIPVIKTDLNGNVIWKKILNAGAPPSTQISVLEESNSGGYYLFEGVNGTTVYKLSNSGNFEWKNNIADPNNSPAITLILGESGDGQRYYMKRITFGANSDTYFTAFDVNTGDLLWDVTSSDLAPSGNLVSSIINQAVPANDGGAVLFFRFVIDQGGTEVIIEEVRRYDADGNLIWEREMPAGIREQIGESKLAASDGGFIFAQRISNTPDWRIVRMTSDGFFEPDCNDGDDCSTVLPALIPGFTLKTSVGTKFYYLSDDTARPTDAQNECVLVGGNLATVNSAEINDALKTHTNGLVYIGLHDEEIEGTLQWRSGANNFYTNFDDCSICAPNSDSKDYVAIQGWNGGWSWSGFYNSRRYWLEIDCNGNNFNSQNNTNTLIALPAAEEKEKLDFQKIVPNPANNHIFVQVKSETEMVIDVEIYDARGVLLKTQPAELFEGINAVEVKITDLVSGFYFVKIPQLKGRFSTQRFVKIRD